MLKALASIAKTSVGVDIASAELQKFRRTKCNTCLVYRPKNDTCGGCGCYLKFKIKDSKERCPLHNW